MENSKHLLFDKKPSSVYTLLKAFQNRKAKYSESGLFPEISIEGQTIVRHHHLKSFNKICGIKGGDINVVYPFTLVYPYIMRLLCQKEVPFSVFRILNTSNEIKFYRSMYVSEKIHIRCWISRVRIVVSGLEADIASEVSDKAGVVWNNITTYFLKGDFSGTDKDTMPRKLRPLSNGVKIKQWHLSAKQRFRFAKISGDTNGIHYVKSYAKMFGFERDFAQPIRIVAKCVDSLSITPLDGPVHLDFILKGPVYYNKIVELYNESTDNGNRFDLYCQGNERPCISGKIVSMAI